MPHGARANSACAIARHEMNDERIRNEELVFTYFECIIHMDTVYHNCCYD